MHIYIHMWTCGGGVVPQILDAPVSWCRKVTLDRHSYAQRFPHAKKRILYQCCVVDKFNEFYPGDSHASHGHSSSSAGGSAGGSAAGGGGGGAAHDSDARTGIVLRVTIFEDEARTKPVEYREMFMHRK